MGNVSSCCKKNPIKQESERNIQAFIQELKPQLENSSSDQIENLVNFIQKQIQFIEDQDINQSSAVLDGAQSVTSSINVASQILEKVSTELDKFQDTNMAKVMGDLTLQVVKVIGHAHWAMLGLSMVALTVERWRVYKSMRDELRDTLNMMVDLATNVKKLWESKDTGRRKQLQNAVQVIVEGVLICDAYLSQQNKFMRYLSANTAQVQLQQIQEKIGQKILSLSAATSTDTIEYLKKNIAEIPDAKWPQKPRNFKAVGIDDRVEKVKELLKMKEEDPVVAVALCGFGGVGKTHLAQSVIYSLKEDKEVSSKFKYCRVDVKKEDTVDTADIKKLQQSIITSLSGKSQHVGDEGKDILSDVIKGKHCFLFINNVHEKSFVNQLLPESLGANSSSGPEDTNVTSSSGPDNTNVNSSSSLDNTKVRILITCREGNFGKVMDAMCDVFDVKTLDFGASIDILLWRITRDKKEVKSDFHEYELITKVAQECKGVPLLLNLFGDHLCDWRRKKGKHAYESVLDVLQRGSINDFGDETLSNALVFVFDNLSIPECKEALLDICTYYYDWDWIRVSCIVGDIILDKLQQKSLITTDDFGNITVHDIILKIVKEKAKGNRIDEQEFFMIRSNFSDLQKVKGLVLSGTSFISLEASELEAMSNSLRHLSIGGCVSIREPCLKEFSFKELRFLSLGDLDGAPFQKSSQLPKLRGFHLSSLDVMERTVPQILQCRDLKVVTSTPKHLDSYFLEAGPDIWKKVRKSRLQMCRLSQYITCHLALDTSFQDDMKYLSLSKFQRVPEIANLKNMTNLSLTKCKIEALPQVTSVLSALKFLDLEWCTKLKSLQLSPFPKLEFLDLEGCTKLEELSEDIQNLQALKFLDLSWCTNLKRLPQNFGKLRALHFLDLTGCLKLEELPASFAELPLKSLVLEKLDSLLSLPCTIGKMDALEFMAIVSCKSIETLPDDFVLLKNLKTLFLSKCVRLSSLPKSFSKLGSLEGLVLSVCESLKELPTDFEALPVLKFLKIESCKNMLELPKSFRDLVSLETVVLINLPIKSLPVFETPNKLKNLEVMACKKLEEFSKDMTLDSIYRIILIQCPSLPGSVLDWILQLPLCVEINIQDSLHLKQRWEFLENNTDATSLVIESVEQWESRSWQRAATTVLLNGPFVEGSGNGEIKSHNSLPLEDCNSVALLCITEVFNFTDFPFLNSEDGTMLTVFFKSFAESETEEVIAKMDESIFEFMGKCPTPAVAIRTQERKRRLCLQQLFFYMWGKADLVANGAACIVAHLIKDESGVLKFAKPNQEKVLNQRGFELPRQTDGGHDLGNVSSDSEDDSFHRQMVSFGQQIQKKKSSNIEKYKSKYGSDKAFLIDAMKKNMYTLTDKNGKEAKAKDILSSNEKFCIYESLLHMWNLILLKHLSETLNMKIVWIVHFNPKEMGRDVKLGCGSYRRMIKNMPDCCWALLQPAKPLVPPSADTPFYLNSTLHYVNEKGEASEDFLQTALFLEFTAGVAGISSGSNFVSQVQTIVSSSISTKPPWLLFMGEKIFKGIMQGKLVFIFAPLKSVFNLWQEKLEQLWQQTHHDHKFDVVHIGPFSMKPPGEHMSYQKYTGIMSTAPWKFLSYSDMVLLWWRICHGGIFPFTIPRLMLVQDGIIITQYAEYIITMLMKEAPNKEENGVDAVIKQELMDSLKKGKCNAFIKTFFVDSIDGHPLHSEHQICSRPFLNDPFSEILCNVCDSFCDTREDKVFGCSLCGLNLCETCWKPYMFTLAMQAKQKEAIAEAHSTC